jgi:ABC-type transport system involved in cytochrome bd biosynthesis fused ATPase/permease subunit
MVYKVQVDSANGTEMSLVGIGFDAGTFAPWIVAAALWAMGMRRGAGRRAGSRTARRDPDANRRTRMTTPALELSDVRKRFGQTEIIRGVTLSIGKGERHALIGPNGAGKSTTFNLISAVSRRPRAA